MSEPHVGFEVNPRGRGVGDLIGRGPHPREAVHWIETWFCAVAMGHWEWTALRWIESVRCDCPEPALAWAWPCNIPLGEVSRWRDALARLPFALTIETACGPVGVVHGESPHRSWPQAVRLLQSGLDAPVNDALLGPDAPIETTRRYSAAFCGSAASRRRARPGGENPSDEVRFARHCVCRDMRTLEQRGPPPARSTSRALPGGLPSTPRLCLPPHPDLRFA